MALLPKSRTQSTYYYRKPDEMTLEDRLDFIYWHPKYESLIQIFASKKFASKELAFLMRTPIVSGKTPKNYVYPMKGIPFIGARNIRNGKVNLTNVTYIDDFIHEGMLKSSKVMAEDILVTMAGSIGRTAMYKDEKEANISQAVARLQPNTKEINPQYLVYYLNSHFGQLQFERYRHDVNQPNINTTEIGKIKVLLPPKRTIQNEITEQLQNMQNDVFSQRVKLKKISKQLSTIIPVEIGLMLPDTIYDYYIQPIESLDERLDFIWNRPITEQIKHYLRLKGAVPLGKIVESDIEYGLNAYGKEKGKIPFVNVENLDLDGMIKSTKIRYLNQATETKLLKENDILISRSRTVGIAGLVTKKEEGFTFGSYILRFRVKPDSSVDPLYLVNFINSEVGQNQITYLQTGAREVKQGGGNNINPDQLRQLLVVKSKTDDQQISIVHKIHDLLKQKEDVKKQIEEASVAFKTAYQSIFHYD